MLAQKSKYALRALLVLAKEYGQGPVLISDIAYREALPHKFLELILLELRNHGILGSKKGNGGGYFRAPTRAGASGRGFARAGRDSRADTMREQIGLRTMRRVPG
jgi:Iron-dependent Transcriptional regulator